MRAAVATRLHPRRRSGRRLVCLSRCVHCFLTALPSVPTAFSVPVPIDGLISGRDGRKVASFSDGRTATTSEAGGWMAGWEEGTEILSHDVTTDIPVVAWDAMDIGDDTRNVLSALHSATPVTSKQDLATFMEWLQQNPTALMMADPRAPRGAGRTMLHALVQQGQYKAFKAGGASSQSKAALQTYLRSVFPLHSGSSRDHQRTCRVPVHRRSSKRSNAMAK